MRFQVRRLGDDNITKLEKMGNSTWGIIYLYMAIPTSTYICLYTWKYILLHQELENWSIT